MTVAQSTCTMARFIASQSACVPQVTTMADSTHGRSRSHDISRALTSKLTLIVRRKAYDADSNFLCEKCAALTYQGMRISERSPEGQLHHDNWTTLREAARLGCRLCTFFTVARIRSKSRPTFYSGHLGPIRLKIEATFEQQLLCLHMCVPQDTKPGVYYLYLKTGKSPDRCCSPNLRVMQTLLRSYRNARSK
jgi:hypothetical protein